MTTIFGVDVSHSVWQEILGILGFGIELQSATLFFPPPEQDIVGYHQFSGKYAYLYDQTTFRLLN